METTCLLKEVTTPKTTNLLKHEEPLTPVVPSEKLNAELAKAKCLKIQTRKGDLQIFVFKADRCKALMREVGRLREIAFRSEGGGTGKAYDTDEYDALFDQIIVWDPKKRKVLGGYRIQLMKTLKKKAHSKEKFSPLTQYFSLSTYFKKVQLPFAAELGRSFVNKSYPDQLPFVLEALFEGLGAWIAEKNRSANKKLIKPIRKPVSFLLGKITLYPEKNDLTPIYHFMHQFFVRKNGIKPRPEYHQATPLFMGKSILESYEKEANKLIKQISSAGLLLRYGKLVPRLKFFGTIANTDFGNTEETAILINVADIHPEYIERYGIKNIGKV